MNKEIERVLKSNKEAGEAWRQARLAEQVAWEVYRHSIFALGDAFVESGEDYGIDADSLASIKGV